MGEAARNLREVPKDTERRWEAVLNELQSSAIFKLDTLARQVPQANEHFSEAREQLGSIFKKFSRIMEMIYHFRGHTGYFESAASESLVNCLVQDSVQEVLHAMTYEVSFANVTVLKIIPHDLAPVGLPQEHLDMILFQLIDNGRRSLGGRAGIVTIEVQEKNYLTPENRGGRRVYIRVSDTGPGLAETDMPYLFEPFFAGTQTRSRCLGLFMVKKIVEMHRGTIRVESSVRGNSFHIELPA